MEALVRQIDAEWGFNLSEEEIKLVVKQAEEAKRLFQKLHEADLGGVRPIIKMDMRPRKVKR